MNNNEKKIDTEMSRVNTSLKTKKTKNKNKNITVLKVNSTNAEFLVDMLSKNLKVDEKTSSLNDEIIKENPNINRYVECYLDNKKETVTTFDPVTYVIGVNDNWNTYKKELYICNREPYCDCKDVNSCLCDDDNDSKITFTIDIVSNCMCNVFINLTNRKYILEKNFFWRIFGIKDDNLSSTPEQPLMDINIIDNQIIFYTAKPRDKSSSCLLSKNVTFDLEEKPKLNSGNISFQFNYMSFSETVEPFKNHLHENSEL
jgi:hypothetical protein